jgi:hypothetical protein
MFDVVCDWICKEGLNKHTCVETVLDLANEIRRATLERCADVITNVIAHGGDMNAALGLIRALAASDSDGGKS